MHYDCLCEYSQHPDRVLGIDNVGLGNFKVVQGVPCALCPAFCVGAG